MISKVIKRLGIGAATIAMAVAFVSPAMVRADATTSVCEGIGLAGGTGTACDEGSGGTSVNSIITTIVSILSIVVGVASVVMIIIGGLKYVTSNGDSGSVTSAKNTIMYALVGLVVAALAQGLVRFVFNKVKSTSVACSKNANGQVIVPNTPVGCTP